MGLKKIWLPKVGVSACQSRWEGMPGKHADHFKAIAEIALSMPGLSEHQQDGRCGRSDFDLLAKRQPEVERRPLLLGRSNRFCGRSSKRGLSKNVGPAGTPLGLVLGHRTAKA